MSYIYNSKGRRICSKCNSVLIKKNGDNLYKRICKLCIENELHEDKMRMKRQQHLCVDSHKECELKKSVGCCVCRDFRPMSGDGKYEGYLDGVGFVDYLKRHEHYCPKCKANCEAKENPESDDEEDEN